jgi:hypothetical protein
MPDFDGLLFKLVFGCTARGFIGGISANSAAAACMNCNMRILFPYSFYGST